MRVHFWEGSKLASTTAEVPVEDSPIGWVWQTQQPLLVQDQEVEERFSGVLAGLKQKGIRSYCALPLQLPKGVWPL